MNVIKSRGGIFLKSGASHFPVLTVFLLLLFGHAAGVHAASAAAIRSGKKVVVLFSYEKQFWAVQDENRGLAHGLATMGYVEGRNVDIIRLYMNTKTTNKTAPQMEAVAPELLAKIKSHAPDLLMVMDDDALRHVGAKLLDTKLPVVFGGINLFPTDQDYGWVTATQRRPLADSIRKPGHNITGVLERIAIGAGFSLMHQILPQAKTALFISDKSILSRQMLRAADHHAARSDVPLKIVKQVFTDDYEVLKQYVLNYQDRVDSIVIFLPWTFVDANGEHVPHQEVVRWLLQNNQRPGIAYLDVLAQEGFLCGVVVDLFQQGIHAGIMAGRILSGEAPGTIPIVNPVANRIMINMARANQLSIDIPFDVLKNADEVLKTMTAYPEFAPRD
jgi:putative tryptophan/tyrosine transport system substrate-binding protein